MAELAQAETEETLQFGSVDNLNKKAFRVIFEKRSESKNSQKRLKCCKKLKFSTYSFECF